MSEENHRLEKEIEADDYQYVGRDTEGVNKDVFRMVYAKSSSFNLVKRSFFKKTMEATEDYDRGYVPPS